MKRPRRPTLARAFALAAVLAGMAPATADGQVPDASTRATARHISEEALEHFRGERWDEALRGFDQAMTLVRMPTLALFSARCLERLGRWVEASERYRLAFSLAVDPALTPAQQDGQRAAQAEARQERDRLTPRIPRLAFGVDGLVLDGDALVIDGAIVPREQLGVERLVDPGRHRVELLRDGRPLDVEEVELREGAREHVRLEVPRPRHVVPAAAPPRASPRVLGAPPDPGPHPLAIAGWSAIGLGGASLVVSAVTFGAAASIDGSDLAPVCGEDRRCPGSARDDLATYDTLRVGSLFALVGGAVVAGVGVALLASVPGDARAQVRVSARGAALDLRF